MNIKFLTTNIFFNFYLLKLILILPTCIFKTKKNFLNYGNLTRHTNKQGFAFFSLKLKIAIGIDRDQTRPLFIVATAHSYPAKDTGFSTMSKLFLSINLNHNSRHSRYFFLPKFFGCWEKILQVPQIKKWKTQKCIQHR